MIIVFWIALGAVLLWFALSCAAVIGMDIWDGADWAFLAGKMFGFVAIAAAVVFVAWFGIHSLGVDIHVSHQGIGQVI